MRANGMTGMDGKSLTIFMKETNVKFESVEFVVCQKSEAEAFKLFVTEKAAEIYADKLNEVMRRV